MRGLREVHLLPRRVPRDAGEGGRVAARPSDSTEGSVIVLVQDLTLKQYFISTLLAFVACMTVGYVVLRICDWRKKRG